MKNLNLSIHRNSINCVSFTEDWLQPHNVMSDQSHPQIQSITAVKLSSLVIIFQWGHSFRKIKLHFLSILLFCLSSISCVNGHNNIFVNNDSCSTWYIIHTSFLLPIPPVTKKLIRDLCDCGIVFHHLDILCPSHSNNPSPP